MLLLYRNNLLLICLKISECKFNWDAPCLAKQHARWLACMNTNITTYKHQDEKNIASSINGWIGQKDRDKLAGLIWKDAEVWVSGKTLIKKMKVM